MFKKEAMFEKVLTNGIKLSIQVTKISSHPKAVAIVECTEFANNLKKYIYKMSVPCIKMFY